MSGICSALPEAFVAVGVMTRVEVPLGVTMEDFCAAGLVAAPPPIEDCGKTKRRKRRSGCRRKRTCGVVADGDGSAGGVHERLLQLGVGGTPQDKQYSQEETDPGYANDILPISTKQCERVHITGVVCDAFVDLVVER